MQTWTALGVEMYKLRYTRIFRLSIVVALVFPLLIGLVMTGAMGVDGAVQVEQDPQTYFMQFEIVVAIGGLIGFGFLFSWLFGREYADGTATDLLALPLGRTNIIMAKFIVAAVWCLFLGGVHFAVAAVFTWLKFPDTTTGAVIGSFLGTYCLTCTMVISLSVPVALVASVGRGYLAPLGFVVLTVVLAQLLGAVGLAAYFPWAVPGLFSGVAGEAAAHLNNVSLALPFAVGLAGGVATVLWWRYVDQT